MEEKTIYDLNMHDSVFIYSLHILRVPCGWIYTNYGTGQTDVFVPYSDEFNKKNVVVGNVNDVK